MKALAYTGQAAGAWLNGATVRKANSQPTDATADGTEGVLMGSIDVRGDKGPASFAYFLIWANRPGVPVFCADTNNDGSPRLELVTTEAKDPLDGLRWQIRKRMEFIRDTLAKNGRINRADLLEEFEISVPQASLDFRQFASLYPGRMVYDNSMQAYRLAQ